MGKVVDFDEANVVKKSGGDYDFPKFKLTNKGDKARITLPESPTYEYVHTLNHPVLEDGVPVMQTKQTRRGEDYQVNKMAFVSRPVCTGDEGILEEKGLDEANCPVCAYAAENPDRMKAPERRYAMHVIQYNTKKNGDLITPFGVQVKVWAFTDRYFNKIVELRKEWGDLKQRDLVLTCDNPDFAGYDIAIGAEAAYLADPKKTELVKETFVEDNKTPDLSIFCGRATEERFLKQDLAKVKQFWAAVDRANGKGGSSVQSLDSAIDGLLGNDAPAAPAVDEGEPFKATRGSTGTQPASTPAPQGDPDAPNPDATKSAAPDFDDILAGL
jgi:hypothetical protein